MCEFAHAVLLTHLFSNKNRGLCSSFSLGTRFASRYARNWDTVQANQRPSSQKAGRFRHESMHSGQNSQRNFQSELLMDTSTKVQIDSADRAKRRTLLSVLSSMAMALGLTGGYGMFATLAGWFLYPIRGRRKGWMFVSDVQGFEPGQSKTYTSPAGEPIVITRLRDSGVVDDFIALSSVCPHLGCRVHWESQNRRFFCPCHNGAFDASGKPVAGPPRVAGQTLARYPLKIENDLLFIEVGTTALA